MSSICRLCSSSSATHYEIISTLHSQQLESVMVLLPEIDANLVQSAVVCSLCIELISTAYFEDIDIKPTIVQQIKTENAQDSNADVQNYDDLDIKRNELASRNAEHCKSAKCNTCQNLLHNVLSVKSHIKKYLGKHCNEGESEYKSERLQNKKRTRSQRVDHKINCLARQLSDVYHHGDEMQKDETENKILLEIDVLKIDRLCNCKLCEKFYNASNNLLYHSRTHFERLQCKICNRSCYSIRQLKKHFLNFHNGNVHSIINNQVDDRWQDEINFEVDEKKFEETLEKLMELNRDLNEKEIECTNLDTNKIVHIDGNKNKSENICIDRKYQCIMCNMSCNIQSNFLDHFKRHFERPKCKFCNKIYYSNHNLKKHIMHEHKIEALQELGIESFPIESPIEQQNLIENKKGIKSMKILKLNYICAICACSKQTKWDLMQHFSSTHKGAKQHECEECGRGFKSRKGLKYHKISIHSTERLFMCEYCSKTFCQKGHLTNHILDIHMKDKIEKKFVCNYCGRKYRTEGKLRCHTVWHIGSRKFNCDICNKAFVSRPGMRRHRIIHFSDKNHKCELCGKKFYQKCNLKTHMKSH